MISTRLVSRPLRPAWGRYYATTAPTPAAGPALLTRIREDLKVAMKTKNTARLDVLRGLISEVTNAAKTSNPVTTDSRMLSIIRKRVQSSEAAAEQFEVAKREDLMKREVAQITMLEEYIDASVSLGEEDVSRAIQNVVGTMRTEGKEVNLGSVMKALVGPGGVLDGQLIDKKEVAKLVESMV